MAIGYIDYIELSKDFKIKVKILPNVIYKNDLVYMSIIETIAPNGINYNWFLKYEDDIYEIQIGEGKVCSFIPDKSGKYYIKIIANISGFNYIINISINVIEKPKLPNSPPVSKISVSSFVNLVNNKITFEAGLYDENYTYQWDFGDGSTAEGHIVTHSYSNYGYYTVTLTVIDNHGLSSVSSVEIYISNKKPEFKKYYFEFNNYIKYNRTHNHRDIIKGIFNFENKITAQTVQQVIIDTIFKIGNKLSFGLLDFDNKVINTNSFELKRYINFNQILIDKVTDLLFGVIVPSVDVGFIPLKVNFDLILSTYKNIAVTWDFGDGSHYFGESASHIYNKTGVFTVKAQISNKDHATTLTTQINVFDIFMKYILNSETEKFYYILFTNMDKLYIYDFDTNNLFRIIGGHGKDKGKFNKPTTLTISF